MQSVLKRYCQSNYSGRGLRPCDVTQRSAQFEKGVKILVIITIIINNLLHLYSAFLDTQSALHSKGAISSSTTNVQHPPG